MFRSRLRVFRKYLDLTPGATDGVHQTVRAESSFRVFDRKPGAGSLRQQSVSHAGFGRDVSG